MNSGKVQRVLVRVGVLLAILAGPAFAQDPEDEASTQPGVGAPAPQPLDPDEIVHIAVTPEGIPLEEFIRTASKETGKVIIIGPTTAQTLGPAGRAPGKNVKFTDTINVPRRELFDTIKAILKANNLFLFDVAAPEVNLFIVEDLSQQAAKGSARTQAKFVEYQELLDDPSWGYRTEIISTVIPLRYLDIARAKSELTPLVDARTVGNITTIPAVNSIIVTEFAPAVRQIAKMLMIMDQEESRYEMLFEKIALMHADPEEMQPILADLLEAEDGGGDIFGGAQRGRPAPGGASEARKAPSPKIIPDPRTNSLIVYAIQEDMDKIKDLIGKLDEEVREVIPDVHRYELKHAVAEQVAETLNQVIEASTGSRFSRNRAAGMRSQQAGAAGAIPEEEVVIVPEPHTNSLLIRASGTQFQWIRQLLDEIDKRLPQVLIEAAVVELTGSFSDTFGVELGYLDLSDDPNANITRGFGFTGWGITEFVDQDGDGIPELRLPPLEGLATGGLTGGIYHFPGFQIPFILQAISTDNESNLLSLPSVLTNDNGSATIVVGSEQATTSSTLAGSGVSQGGFSGYQSADLTLEISPHISSDDYLRLDINLDVVSFTGSERIISGQVIPAPRTKRTVNASVTVPNESTVILGGLIQNQTTDSRSKVPFFGDLPLVGWLFRTTTSSEDKRTLYLFVTPHILKDEDFTDLFELTRIKELEVHALIGDEIKLFDPDFTLERPSDRVVPYDEKELDEYLRELDIPRYRSPSEVERTPEPEASAAPSAAPAEMPVDGAAEEAAPSTQAPAAPAEDRRVETPPNLPPQGHRPGP